MVNFSSFSVDLNAAFTYSAEDNRSDTDEQTEWNQRFSILRYCLQTMQKRKITKLFIIPVGGGPVEGGGTEGGPGGGGPTEGAPVGDEPE